MVVFTAVACPSISQKCYDYKHPCHPGDTLVDKFSHTKFTTDTSHKYLIALDLNNKILWQTNPWTIQEFRSYDSSMNKSFRSNHISSFFLSSKRKKHSNFIFLHFHNSPIAAVIEKKNGIFHLLGVM